MEKITYLEPGNLKSAGIFIAHRLNFNGSDVSNWSEYENVKFQN